MPASANRVKTRLKSWKFAGQVRTRLCQFLEKLSTSNICLQSKLSGCTEAQKSSLNYFPTRNRRRNMAVLQCYYRLKDTRLVVCTYHWRCVDCSCRWGEQSAGRALTSACVCCPHRRHWLSRPPRPGSAPSRSGPGTCNNITSHNHLYNLPHGKELLGHLTPTIAQLRHLSQSS